MDAENLKELNQSEKSDSMSRRKFIGTTGFLLAGTVLKLNATTRIFNESEPIIDIHQHLNYAGRINENLITHQRAMGITTTILLPAGRPMNLSSTNNGESNGLEGKITGNREAMKFVKQYPKEFFFAANEVPDSPDALKVIEKYLKRGAIAIGELKFNVNCDSPEMQKIYHLAQDYNVPVLMHWQYGRFNNGFDRFHTMLKKFPNVNFIGHAQTWWANIDRYNSQIDLYPKGKVTPGGWTDRYLSDYPNMYGDLSAGSGLNALTRDEDQTREFLSRHQDKLMYGSDCADADGLKPEECQGAQTITALRKLSASKQIERKLLYENAKKLFRL